MNYFQSSVALAAVALQDHMTRSLSLQDPFKKKKINHSLPTASKKRTTKAAVNRDAKDDQDKKEYVLDPKPPPLTLGMTEYWCIPQVTQAGTTSLHKYVNVFTLCTYI